MKREIAERYLRETNLALVDIALLRAQCIHPKFYSVDRGITECVQAAGEAGLTGVLPRH
ncbi:hypothetical protein [Marinobacter salexigens]|uniref:hypothetical protein n=1 Tax=Marinobacter salexigens TaxID=1925763 RepID=UPI0013747AB6|nr:hypothetical protein [Marinobacter salexigens]